MQLGYTTILHEPRIKLGLTTNEYCLADTIYRLSTNPKGRIKGWCDARKDTLGLMIGVSKQTVITLIKKIESKGLIIKSEDGRLLRSGDKWIDEVVDFSFTKSKDSLPEKVKKVDQKQGKDSLPNNNTLFNNDIDNNIIHKFNFKDSLIKYGFEKELVEDWLKVRKTKRATNTKTAFNGFINEIKKQECNINDLLRYVIEKNWISFKWEWINKEKSSDKKESNFKRVLNLTENVQSGIKNIKWDE